MMCREEGVDHQVTNERSTHVVLLPEFEQLLALGLGQKFEKIGDGDNGRWPSGAAVAVLICE